MIISQITINYSVSMVSIQYSVTLQNFGCFIGLCTGILSLNGVKCIEDC